MIRLLILIISIWIILAILGGIGEGVYLGQQAYGAGATAGEEGILNDLMNWKFMTADTFLGKIGGLFTDLDFYSAFAQMVLFDFSFFTGGWAVFQWIFFIPLAIALMATLAATFVWRVGTS